MNLPESVATGLALLQVGSKELLGEAGLDGVKEGGLLFWLDRVDAAESKSEETVIVGILGELRGHRGGGLNSLAGGRHATHNDLVGEDVARGTGTITVADVPAVALKLLAGSGVVETVALRFALGCLVRESPAA